MCLSKHDGSAFTCLRACLWCCVKFRCETEPYATFMLKLLPSVHTYGTVASASVEHHKFSRPGCMDDKPVPSSTSRVKAFPGRPTNYGSTLPRAAYLDGGVIQSHQCITSHLGSTPASPDMRPTHLALPRMHAIHHLHPCRHPTQHHSHDQLLACTNRLTSSPSTRSSSASDVFLGHLW